MEIPNLQEIKEQMCPSTWLITILKATQLWLLQSICLNSL